MLTRINRELCRRMQTRFQPSADGSTLRALAEACSLGPHARIEPDQQLAWAEAALKVERNICLLNTAAMANNRAGHFDRTLALIIEANQLARRLPKIRAPCHSVLTSPIC